MPPLPYQFFPCNSTNVGISPQNFQTFSFNPLATLVLNFKFVPSVCPKLLNLNQDHPSKKADMLELPNCDHMTTSAILFESRDKILLVTSLTEIMMS